MLGLIGPNGAGKTTFINLLTGALYPQQGSVYLRGTDITRLPTERRVRAGLARTHQIVRPFTRLSVIDNVALAAGRQRTASALHSLFEFRRSEERGRAAAVLERLGLGAVLDRNPAELPLGQLKRLEVARALALDPDILLLDEPLAGLNQREAAALAKTIAELNQEGLTIILVEHNLAEVLNISTRLAVLDRGQFIAEGPCQAVIDLPEVRDAYIGKAQPANA
ncbi:ABC transporter ATP-binding protein [Bradyrhizobium genosp. P]|uniref:ABC transporter ATP-binding protein n=1 Tax=Bradyrhizobium genosp. P TaxID=83641 RepID=UPI003CF7F23A